MARLEKFQRSPSPIPENGAQRQTYKCSKPTIVVNKPASELEALEEDRHHCRESDKADVVLNVCSDRTELNVSIDGANIKTTKTSLNASIGNFSITINFLDRKYKPLPSTVTLISISLGKPLFVVLGESPHLTAAVSLSKLNCQH